MSLTEQMLQLENGTPFLWVDTCEELASAKLQQQGATCLLYGKASTGETHLLTLKENLSLLGAQLHHPNLSLISRTPLEIERNARDTRRFIAHAGGKIDGITYTNSLEALDKSYAKGIRLFELDIISTSDGKYVAAHDWEHWRLLSGYEGEIPPSHSTFMKHNIKKNYSPMDMEGINRWFTTHPDAILVTDKVNEPARFAKQFIDKGRLMMELFSKEALNEGLSAGILSAMPNWALLNKGFSPSELQIMGINAVVMSRRAINENLPLLKELEDFGINVYVFHVNLDEGKDETFVVCNDMNFIYGLYADSYDFDQPANCEIYR